MTDYADLLSVTPLCAVSLGLINERQAVLGVIDLPFLGSRYSAAEGHGAQSNSQRASASAALEMSARLS